MVASFAIGGGLQRCALQDGGPSGKPDFPETLSWEGCTFPKAYSGKAEPPRNPVLGRLYLPETLCWEGCIFPKPYSRKTVPSRNPLRITGLRRPVSARPQGAGGRSDNDRGAGDVCGAEGGGRGFRCFIMEA